MPNYAKLEQAMLSADQLALVANSRNPAIASLDQDALYDLIAKLETALKSAGPNGENGEVTVADLFQAALRRAQADRRKRGLKPEDSGTTTAEAKTTSRQPPVRKRADRAAAKKRKDARTASRRVTSKGAAKPAAASAQPVPAVDQAADTAAEPATEENHSAPKPAPVKNARKAAAQKARKAAEEAEKEAKAARKEARKAIKRAEKATRVAAEKLAALSPGKKSKRKKKKG